MGGLRRLRAPRGRARISQAVADASEEQGITFRDIGPAELEGVSGSMRLLRAELG